MSASMMAPHQLRVVAEKQELDTKLEALRRFFSTGVFMSLDPEEQIRLGRQELYMGKYSQVLGERIAALGLPSASFSGFTQSTGDESDVTKHIDNLRDRLSQSQARILADVVSEGRVDSGIQGATIDLNSDEPLTGACTLGDGGEGCEACQ